MKGLLTLFSPAFPCFTRTQRFIGLHERGELLDPALPGGVLAGLALQAAKGLSGTFVSWDADELNEYRMDKAE